MISGVLTSGSPVLGRFLPTYSGRVISAGTWRAGESRPGCSTVAMLCESNVHGQQRGKAMVVQPQDAYRRGRRRSHPGQGPARGVSDPGSGRTRAGNGAGAERRMGRERLITALALLR